MWRLAAAFLGVLIAFNSAIAAEPAVTFSRDIAPLVFAKCASCHHPGESAPFTLLSLQDVRRHAKQIVKVTQLGIMPPWLPKAGDGDFIGERRLNAEERDLLKRWVDQGMPAGDETKI